MARADVRPMVALFSSGAAALGYEILWTRLLGLSLGHELLGMLAALAGFFGGLALGAALLHDRVRRGPDPVRLFVRLELAAAAWAVVTPLLLHALSTALPRALGPSIAEAGPSGIAAAVLVATAMLAPATVCMGGTLPALVEARRRFASAEPPGRGVGRLYAANTAGALFGTLAAVHLILPTFGLGIGAAVLAGLGATAAIVAAGWREGRGHAPVEAAESPAIDCSRDPDPDLLREPWLVLALVLGTGLVGVGVEVVGVRILAQVFSDTVYTFAHVLAVWLAGTAIGAWLYQARAARAVHGAPARVTAALLLALAGSVVVSAQVLRAGSGLVAGLASTAPGFAARALAETLVAALAFALPTVLMGALFSHLLALLAERGIGRALALNMFGSALAPFVLGVLAVPELGLTDAWFALAWAYLGLMAAFCWFRRFSTTWQLVAGLSVLAATVIGRGSLVLVAPPEGWVVLERHETPLGVVMVSEREEDNAGPPLRRLQLDREFRMGGALAIGEQRMGHIPVLLHPAPRNVLFLGVGTGATAGAALAHPVEHLDAVELVPEILAVLHWFHDINHRLDEDARVALHAGDARRWLAGSGRSFDVVVADLFHPERDGAGFLWSREHFQAARDRLAPGGLFVQWLPLHQLDPAGVQTIAATFLDVFPRAHGWLALYNVESPAFGLIGHAEDTELLLDIQRIVARAEDPALAAAALGDPRELVAGYLLDRAALQDLAGDAPLNTDLRPRILFDAPRVRQERLGILNLEEILRRRVSYPEGMVVAGGRADQGGFRGQADAFGDALERYLRAEIALSDRGTPGEPSPPEAVDGWLAALAAAPEFSPARGRLRAEVELLRRGGREAEARALIDRAATPP